MRAHIVLPDDLVEAVDTLVGKRGRSRFVTDAVRDRLRRHRLRRAMDSAAGALKAGDYPEWETSQKVSAWVSKVRRQSERRVEKLRGRVSSR